ncbi:MAG: hypothetical protein ACR2NZ_11585 [Rubripirellula sp.]
MLEESWEVMAGMKCIHGLERRRIRRLIRLCFTVCGFLCAVAATHVAQAAGGNLLLSVADEQTEEPTITRTVLLRADAPSKRVVVRKTVPAGVGFVLDRSVELSLSDAAYQFRMIRGPEYRIISGTFTLEKTSLDEHAVDLPRMVDMLSKGWTSGDCCVPASPYSLPLRMASEDLHLAAVLGHVDAKPIPGRPRDDPPQNDPSWIHEQTSHVEGLAFYRFEFLGRDGSSASTSSASTSSEGEAEVDAVDEAGNAIPASAEEGSDAATGDAGEPANAAQDLRLPVERLVQQGADPQVRVAIENPFAWPLPVWLASGHVDGIFLLGDWLRLDRKVLRITDGRGPQGASMGGNHDVGRWAERIYWNLLEAGFRLPPLAGAGDQGRSTPVGYNRLYVANPLEAYREDGALEALPVNSQQNWWNAAWKGQSVATNGPLLRPKLGGQIPGHVFQATSGEVLQLQPELTLTVRDPVEYLEVIHNGIVHYSARLDEFAKAGGVIPPIMIKESSWVTIRVVTLYEDHFRAAMSAPWYIDFDGRRRVTAKGVQFFRDWLSDYETRLTRLPAGDLQRHVPYIRGARAFWSKQAELVVVE